jgi:hypothetical protein
VREKVTDQDRISLVGFRPIPLPKRLRELVRKMAGENPTWGEEQIANELRLKLGIRVSLRTVRKYPNAAKSPKDSTGSSQSSAFGPSNWSV